MLRKTSRMLKMLRKAFNISNILENVRSMLNIFANGQSKSKKVLPDNNLPDWANFKVASSAKYLGFVIGPGAGAKLLEGLMKKLQNLL